MGVARDQLPKLPHIRDDARFVCSPPVRRSSRLVRLLHMDAWMRLTQRGNGFVGDIGAGGEVNVGHLGAVGGEDDDRGVGDVGAEGEVHGREGRAVGGEGDDTATYFLFNSRQL